MADEPTAETTYSHDQISTALNRAADQITELDVIDDEAARDALNLLVNAGLHYLENPQDSLADVIDANWGEREREEIHELLS